VKQVHGHPDRDALISWVAQWTDPKERKIAMIGLNHVPEDSVSGDPVTNRPFPKIDNSERRKAEAASLVDEYLHDADNWAATFRKPQRFTLSAHEKVDANSPVLANKVFVVVPNKEYEVADDAGPRETVTLLKSLVVETNRSRAEAEQSNADRWFDEVKQLRAHNRTIEAKLLETVLKLQDALNEQNKREMEARRAGVTIDAWNKVIGLAEAWMMKEMAKPRPASQLNAQDLLSFLATMTPEQLEAGRSVINSMLSTLSPEQQQELKRLAQASKLNGASKPEVGRA
jgi:hypothetical protein